MLSQVRQTLVIDEPVLAPYSPRNGWECSSAVEHTVHIGVVTGSIPVTPTIHFTSLNTTPCPGLSP